MKHFLKSPLGLGVLALTGILLVAPGTVLAGAGGAEFQGACDRFSPFRPAETPRHYWAGGRFRISRGWLHRDLQELQYLFLLGCWGTIPIELNTVDGHAIARDLRQAVNHPTECPASVFALAIVGKERR